MTDVPWVRQSTSVLRALTALGARSLDRLAGVIPEILANRIEKQSRYRRLVLRACGESGLSALLLRAGPEGLSFEQILEGVAPSLTSLRLLIILGCAYGFIRPNRRTRRYRATRALRVEMPSQLYQMFDAYPSFLMESIRTGTNAALRLLPGPGTTLYERLESYPELEQQYAAGLAHANATFRLPMVLEGLRRLDGQVSHVLDIGGSTGITAAAIVERYPHVRVTVFDLPSVCAKGRARCTHTSIDFVEGNVTDASLPMGADCVILSAILEVMPVDQARLLMRRIHEALRPGGHVLIVQGAMDEFDINSVPSAAAAVFFFNVCAPSPMSQCTGDMRSLAEEAGFTSFDIHRPNRDSLAIMTLRK